MSSRAETTSRGLGFGSLLAILFIGLKLANIIQWSWIWVLAPLWFPIALLVTILLVFGVFALIGVAASKSSADA